jgi:hypothetical protein
MRLFAAALCTALSLALLVGCSSENRGPQNSPVPSVDAAQTHFRNGHLFPHWSQFASVIPVELRPSGLVAKMRQISRLDQEQRPSSGIYASEFYGSDAYGYSDPNNGNAPPLCSDGPLQYPNDIALDHKGDLIDPDGGTDTIVLFAGPNLCGAEIGSISDPFGQPSDASSRNVLGVKAAGDTIVVGNIYDNNDTAGSISVCNLSSGCTTNLTNPNMYETAGVAIAPDGDCWVSAINSVGAATLTYFAQCSGSGVAATGFQNAYYGGLDIDANGNLVSISAFDQNLYIYSGCNPACTLVGGPFPLSAGAAIYGHLDERSNNFVAADYANGQLDVYSYSTSGLTYEYSVNNGLAAADLVEGAAFAPRSKE